MTVQNAPKYAVRLIDGMSYQEIFLLSWSEAQPNWFSLTSLSCFKMKLAPPLLDSASKEVD